MALTGKVVGTLGSCSSEHLLLVMQEDFGGKNSNKDDEGDHSDESGLGHSLLTFPQAVCCYYVYQRS